MPSPQQRRDPSDPSPADDPADSGSRSPTARSGAGPYPVTAAPAGVEPPAPPAAPEIERRVRFRFGQLVGLSLLATIPVMGLAGVFGTTLTTCVGGDETVTVSLSYPSAQRYKVRHRLAIEVTNTGALALAAVEVRLSNAYLLSFSDVALTPAPDRVDETDHVFVLTDLPPGQTRSIVAEMQANAYWMSRGTVTWSATGPDGAVAGSGDLSVATLTWP